MKYHKAANHFTLVELLVVIAIISILAGMPLPALENSIGTSRQISCMNQKKQLGIAINIYTDDYNNYLPPGPPWKQNVKIQQF